jgi:hypothetical protein
MNSATTTIRTMKARDIPRSWEVELPDEAVVEVVITPLPSADGSSPRCFLGAGSGLFASAAEVDSYIRRHRDAWGE